MDAISLFSYFPGTSPLHRFDPRLKMAAVIAISIGVFLADSTGLIILTVVTGVLLVLSGYPLLKGKNLRQMRGIFVLAVLIFAGRTFFGGTPAETGAFSLTPSFTQEGLARGLQGAWRLMLFAAAGLLFTVSTTTIRMQDGIVSVLRPVPFIPEQKIAVMMSLSITFVPLIFTISREISEVHRSRGITITKRPLRRIILFTSHVMVAILKYSDGISTAMASRAFGDARTRPEFTVTSADIVLFILIVIGTGGALTADKLLPLF